ncbi:MAG: VPLPA-CTERM sorting domain-containing protein [Rhodobacterales bacterium]|nr:VPLPA-CTERM sorting domain-containing protein [Rhodobacterales bacterium]
MFNRSPLILPLVTILLSSTAASAAILGTPSFTTAPATVSVVNEFAEGGRYFDVGNAPYDSYTVSVNTTIASSFGLPSLVGSSLSFSYGMENGISFDSFDTLKIAGVEVLVDPLYNEGPFLFYPPIASIDPGGPGEFDTFYYAAPFTDFGPRSAEFPEFVMSFEINQPLPTKTGFEQCNALDECEFSNSLLADIGGSPVTVFESYDYIEGHIDDGTLTFYTPGGPPPAVVPLPAAGLLLLGPLGALAAWRRRRHI